MDLGSRAEQWTAASFKIMLLISCPALILPIIPLEGGRKVVPGETLPCWTYRQFVGNLEQVAGSSAFRVRGSSPANLAQSRGLTPARSALECGRSSCRLPPSRHKLVQLRKRNVERAIRPVTLSSGFMGIAIEEPRASKTEAVHRRAMAIPIKNIGTGPGHAGTGAGTPAPPPQSSGLQDKPRHVRRALDPAVNKSS